MPSRFTFVAMAVAAPLLLAACEREGQQQAETSQAEEPQTAETEAAAPPPPQPGEPPAMAEPQPPVATEPGEQAATPPDAGTTEGEVVVVPPEGETQAGEQQTQAPGERSPEAAGVASVAAYVGRWAEQVEMCQQSYWTFTNLRLQTPEGVACDIQSTGEQEGGVSLEVACTDQDQPLAEPRRGTMTLAFPNLPETDTMTVTGGPLEGEERTLSRCPLG